MSKTAFMFPGQGSQCVGMGADFYEACPKARAVYDMASELIGIDMKRLCFEENEHLDQTEFTQIALLTTGMAMEQSIRACGLTPDVTAGLSLGEYNAIVSAGGMEMADAMKVVRRRGILMEEAVPAGEGAMAAVLGMEDAKIEEILSGISGAYIANYNCPGQIVITGYEAAVAEASEKLKEAGAKRVLPLNVSGPFHSPMMEAASQGLTEALEGVGFMELKIPYVTNVTGQYVRDTALTRGLLIQQVASGVRWQQSIEAMIADGVDTFVEIGPGRTLTGFLRKINRDVKGYNIRTYEEMGIHERDVTVIGTSDVYRTGTGYAITPVLAVVPPDIQINPSPTEVAAWFEAPVDFVFDSANHTHHGVSYLGQERRYIEIMWQQHRIWGVTAAIINNLSRRIDWHG